MGRSNHCVPRPGVWRCKYAMGKCYEEEENERVMGKRNSHIVVVAVVVIDDETMMKVMVMMMKDTRVMSEGKEDVDDMTVEAVIEEMAEIGGMVMVIEIVMMMVIGQMVGETRDTAIVIGTDQTKIAIVDEETIEEMMMILSVSVVPNSINLEALAPRFLPLSFLHNYKPIKNVICND